MSRKSKKAERAWWSEKEYRRYLQVYCEAQTPWRDKMVHFWCVGMDEED